MINSRRPRIFWFEAAHKWAINAVALADVRSAEKFTASLRQQCRAVFNKLVNAWMIDDCHLGAAQKIVANFYGHYEFVARQRAQAAPPPPPPPPERPRSAAYIVFCALVGWDEPADLSYDRARDLYRHAAARLHPDVG